MSTDVYIEFVSEEFLNNEYDSDRSSPLREPALHDDPNHYLHLGRLGYLSNFIYEPNYYLFQSLKRVFSNDKETGNWFKNFTLPNIREEFLVIYRHIYLYAHLYGKTNPSEVMLDDMLSPEEVEEIFNELYDHLDKYPNNKIVIGLIRVD